MLPTVAENLALDEGLLEAADAGQAADEILRLWRAESLFVVVGRSSRVAAEVQRDVAQRWNVPIFRRVSGGTSIVAGPGCLFYSVLLDLEQRPHLRMLDEAHRFVMSTLKRGIAPLRPDVRFVGTCDLVVPAAPRATELRKFSGNALRVGRRWMLYHGTLLVDMQLQWISQLLKHPPREPDYRAGREHSEFLTNLHVDQTELIASLQQAWRAEGAPDNLPTEIVARLVDERYALDAWNFQR
jgi:lipoate-protein ligase A